MDKRQHIVVVEDEAAQRQLLFDYLTRHGYRVTGFQSGVGLRRLVEREMPALVLLDVGLPGEDGFALARWLREHHDPGIVMLTGADTLVDRVVGLEIGADDHVGKPFDLAELRARIEAVLRRRVPRAQTLPEGMLRFGRFRFDTKRFRLTEADGAEVPLLAMELDLVAAFATCPGQVLGREDLLRLAPPRGEDSFDRSVDNRITRLRRKLERDPVKPELIKTVRGLGYIYPG